ncbi:MAG: hypothetical protein ACREBU_10140 [Nitrososphaera sp.]
MKQFLIGFAVVVLAADMGLAAVPPMPDLENDYRPASYGRPCESVGAIAYEASDDSTLDDPSYPLIAWYRLDGSAKELQPFLVVLYDSKDGRIRAFWLDYDRDGEADEFGDLKRLKEIVPSLAVCDLAKRVT